MPAAALPAKLIPAQKDEIIADFCTHRAERQLDRQQQAQKFWRSTATGKRLQRLKSEYSDGSI